MRTFRILAALMMAVVCVSLSSCSKDDESKEKNMSSIVGTWIYTTQGGNKEIVTFKSDNKGTWESYDKYDDESNMEIFSYTFDGSSKLILDWGDNEPETYKVAIINNKMNLTYEDGHSESYIKQ